MSRLRLSLRSSIDLSEAPERAPITTDGLLGRSAGERVPVPEFYRQRQVEPESVLIIRGPNETIERVRSQK